MDLDSKLLPTLLLLPSSEPGGCKDPNFSIIPLPFFYSILENWFLGDLATLCLLEVPVGSFMLLFCRKVEVFAFVFYFGNFPSYPISIVVWTCFL